MMVEELSVVVDHACNVQEHLLCLSLIAVYVHYGPYRCAYFIEAESLGFIAPNVAS